MALPDVSDRWIKFSYWFLSNRKDLTRWWVLVLIALDIFLVVYTVTNGVLVLVTYPRVQQSIAAIGTSRIVTGDVQTRNTPKPITMVQIDIIPESASSSLVVAHLKNTNTDWTATNVTFHFSSGSSSFESRSTFLLPLEERVVLASEDVTTKPTITIDASTWERTPSSLLPKVPITFSKGAHEFITTKNGSTQKTISQITTTVTNQSLYTVKKLKGTVLVTSGTSLIGARQFFIDALKPNEAHETVIQFPDPLPPFTAIQFVSELNTLDPANLTP